MLKTNEYKLSPELVKELKKVENVEFRKSIRSQFKTSYSYLELYERFIKEANETLPEDASQWEIQHQVVRKERLPDYESEFNRLKEKISKLHEELKDFLNGNQKRSRSRFDNRY